jgi:hypothetical protein
MSISRGIRIAAIALTLVVVAGCDVAPFGPAVPPGGRTWTIKVINRSPRPATLVVAIDGLGAGRVVGTANPGVVPPGTTVDVVFGVPPGDGWAIFVNPGPNMGPLLLPTDVPLADLIEIGADGGPSWTYSE